MGSLMSRLHKEAMAAPKDPMARVKLTINFGIIISGLAFIIVSQQGQNIYFHKNVEVRRDRARLIRTPSSLIDITNQVLKEMNEKEIGRDYIVLDRSYDIFKPVTIEHALDKGYTRFSSIFKSGHTVIPQLESARAEYDRLGTLLDPKVFTGVMRDKPLIIYQCRGHQVEHRGHRTSKPGAAIGMPGFYSYSTPQDISHSDSVRFSSDLQSLLLSERAKKFGLAREICWVQVSPAHLITAWLTPCTLLCVVLACTISTLSAPLKVLGVVTTTSSYPFLYKQVRMYLEKKMDRLVCTISPDYVEGGIEFYDKERRRGEILGKYGKGPSSPLTSHLSWLHPLNLMDNYLFKTRRKPAESVAYLQSLPQNSGSDGQNSGSDGQNSGSDGQMSRSDEQNSGSDGQNSGSDGQNSGRDELINSRSCNNAM